jgi:hypothetical protein
MLVARKCIYVEFHGPVGTSLCQLVSIIDSRLAFNIIPIRNLSTMPQNGLDYVTFAAY